MRQETARFQPLFGGALDRDQVRQLGLIDQALDKLVDGAVFANATRDFGLTVNEEMIRHHILSERAFHDARGQFDRRSEEHTSELQSLMRISYAVFCLKK